ncbi:MAG: hypothetical protein AAGA02_01615 [Bacteroidota bacterium]
MKLVLKSVGKRFFFENAGPFLFLFFILFGFLKAEEHIAIAKAISKSNTLLSITIVLWSIYTATCTIFFLIKLNQPAYRFLWNLSFVPLVKRACTLTVNQGFMNMPATFHALLIMNFSILNQEHTTSPILAYLLFAHTLPICAIQYKLSGSHQINTKFRVLNHSVVARLKKPVWCWSILFSIKERPAFWLISKPLGILILQAFFRIDQSQHYPIIWLKIGVLTVFSVNIPLLVQLQEYHKQHSSLINNLPIRPFTHWARMSLSISVLVSLESMILIYLWPAYHSYVYLLALVFFGFALNLASYTVLMIRSYDQDKFFRQYFWFFIVLFIAILSGFPISILGACGVLISIVLYGLYYRLMIW